jgi:hypothetical protein
MFDVAQKSSKFLLEIMTLVSSADIMGSASGKMAIDSGATRIWW